MWSTDNAIKDVHIWKSSFAYLSDGEVKAKCRNWEQRKKIEEEWDMSTDSEAKCSRVDVSVHVALVLILFVASQSLIISALREKELQQINHCDHGGDGLFEQIK